MRVMTCLHPDEGLRLIRAIKKADGLPLCRPSELYLIYSLAKAQGALAGEFAEVGVYQGSTAQLLCEIKGQRELHLFDTFQGLPTVEDADCHYSEGMFAAELEQVRKRLAHYGQVFFHAGLFPQTATAVTHTQFSFVHLDADLYQSTKDALEFFYPRLIPGGIILTHDHPTGQGVSRAFSEFLTHKPETLIQLPLAQGMIIKQ